MLWPLKVGQATGFQCGPHAHAEARGCRGWFIIKLLCFVCIVLLLKVAGTGLVPCDASAVDCYAGAGVALAGPSVWWSPALVADADLKTIDVAHSTQI